MERPAIGIVLRLAELIHPRAGIRAVLIFRPIFMKITINYWAHMHSRSRTSFFFLVPFGRLFDDCQARIPKSNGSMEKVEWSTGPRHFGSHMTRTSRPTIHPHQYLHRHRRHYYRLVLSLARFPPRVIIIMQEKLTQTGLGVLMLANSNSKLIKLYVISRWKICKRRWECQNLY